MTSINHSNNLCLVTLHCPSSTPPSSSSASPSSTSSTGWTQKITKKIQELKNRQNELNDLKNLKNDQSGYLTEQDSKSLDSLPTQVASLETVQKLAEFADTLDTNKNPSNNILNNLCTGLEKFLGFNSDSKGYDGQGIVYSDLDRLCDGVMGFLLKCLQGSETLLTHYNTDIPRIIQELKSSIGKGLGVLGFAQAVGKVKSGLQGYEEGMEEKSKKVVDDISTIKNAVETLSNKFKSMHDTNLSQQLKDAKQFAALYYQKAEDAETARTALDSTLSGKLDKHVNLVVQAVTSFKEVAGDGDLEEAVNAVDFRLKTQLRSIIQTIENQSSTVRNALNGEFDKIQSELTGLKDNKLVAEIQLVREHIHNAQNNLSDLLEDFGRIFKTPINGKFDEIVVRLVNVDPRGKSQSELQKQVKQINTQLLHVGEELGKYVAELSRRIQGAEDIRKKAEDKAYDLYKQLDYTNRKTVIGQEINKIELSKFVIKDINKLLEKEIKKVENWKEQATELVKAALLQVTAIVHKLDKAKNKELNAHITSITSKVNTLHQSYDLTQRHLAEIAGDANSAYKKLGNLKDDVHPSVNHVSTSLIGTLSRQGGNLMTKMKNGKIKKDAFVGTEDVKDTDIKKLFEDPVEGELQGALHTAAQAGVQELYQRIQRDPDVGKLRGAMVDVKGVEHADVIGLNDGISSAVSGIESQLTDISGMIQKDADASGTIKGYLDDLHSGLHKKEDCKTIAGGVKLDGLQNIHDVIERLKTTAFSRTEDITKAVDGMTKELGKLQMELVHAFSSNDLMEQLEKLNKKIGKLDKSDNTSLELLHRSLEDLKTKEFSTNESGQIQHATMTALATAVDLEDVPAAVQVARSAAEGIMVQVEEHFKKQESHLTSICTMLDTVENHLTNGISIVEGIVNESERAIKDALSHLKTTLTRTVSSAFQTLTHQVQSLFAKQKQAELSALEGVVAAQLREIERVIREDRGSGVKGFLRRLKGDVDARGSAVSPNKLDALVAVVSHSGGTSEALKRFRPLATVFKRYVDDMIKYIEGQVMTLKDLDTSSQGKLIEHNKQSNQVTKINRKFDELLDHLINNDKKICNYDSTFCAYLRELINAVGALTADAFGEGRHPELLNLLKEAMTQFDKHLNYAYVSTYSKQRWVYDDSSRYAKVCLTTLPILYTELKELKEEIEKTGDNWRFYSMYNSSQPDACLYGVFFRHNGYDHDLTIDAECGELNHKMTFNGGHIVNHLTNKEHNLFSPAFTRLAGASGSHSKSDEITLEVVSEDGLIPKLYAALEPYNKVGHLATASATKSPCSVFEQLVWLGGLQFNSVYDSLMEHVEKLFLVDNENNPPEKISKPIEAYPRTVSPQNICHAIEHVSSHAYMVITAILGTGDEYTTYATDMCNNSLKFHYPKTGEDCLDMLLDILHRMLPTLMFLKKQCKLKAKHHGWYDCKYGKNVASAKWPCKEHLSEQATGQPNCEPNCQPKTEVNCQPNSPLMSYLNDCLPGHLPHRLTKIGCKYECLNCPSALKKGMRCLTPLGFRGFSGSTKTGKDLCDVLDQLFGDRYLSGVFILAPRPPSTLPEHFGFCLSLVTGINIPKADKDYVVTLQDAMATSIVDQSVNLYTQANELTKALTNAYGSEYVEHSGCEGAHLRNLTTSDKCKNKTDKQIECAPYLFTLCRHSYRYLARKHADLYLSWAVYLPWDFWSYLRNLYDAFCGIDCQDWGCRSCLTAGSCKTGKHGVIDKDNPTATCQCTSIVTCKGVSPQLYQYGFSFQNPSSLNHKDYPNRCSDFCTQLDKLLHSTYFSKLFKKCDEFLWIIRQPFIWLNVALWSLSLFYLICVMVGRLDVLHIRSHLRTPSSHKITAQSLLAAAQVGRLAKISYLQP